MDGLTIKNGRLINERPNGMTGIQQAANMKRIIDDTKDIGKVETHPKFEGRQMIMIIQPN